MIGFAIYNSNHILNSGQTMKSATITNRLYELYMPSVDPKNDKDRVPYVDMMMRGKGVFKALFNLEGDGQKQGENLILPKCLHCLERTVIYVGDNCLSRSVLTRKNLSNFSDIKKQRLMIHVKEVMANCKKAL